VKYENWKNLVGTWWQWWYNTIGWYNYKIEGWCESGGLGATSQNLGEDVNALAALLFHSDCMSLSDFTKRLTEMIAAEQVRPRKMQSKRPPNCRMSSRRSLLALTRLSLTSSLTRNWSLSA